MFRNRICKWRYLQCIYYLVQKILLTSIDPFQKTQWNSNGLKLLTNSKLINRHNLIEKSYEALPELLKDNKNKFDFIFIDGWHTFDYTLIDFFYEINY